MNAEERSKRLIGGNIYLKNDYEGIVLRSSPGETGLFFVKFTGRREYEINHSTNLVNETLLEWDEITKEAYDKF